jgi:predicted membrane-bound spermidine synthase
MDSAQRTIRFYLNDYLTQNTYDPARKQSVSHFTYMLAGLARAYSPGISNVLCIGMGVGIVPMDFAHQGAHVEVVEINPAIVPVATRFFDFEPTNVALTIDDGRHFLNRCTTQYDAVVLDAFLGDSSPSHLLTQEAFASIHHVLRPNGVLTINVFGDVQVGKDFFAASLNKTLRSVFKSVHIHTSGDGGLFYVASDRTPLEFLHPPQLTGLHPHVTTEAREAYETVVDTDPEHGRVLTDDYNPVEFYDAHNREDVRRRLAMAVKKL